MLSNTFQPLQIQERSYVDLQPEIQPSHRPAPESPAGKKLLVYFGEYARAIRAGHLIRTALAPALETVECPQLRTRLVRVLNQVIRSDRFNGSGERRPEDGDLRLLKKFECSDRVPLHEIFRAHYECRINRQKGESLILIPPFDPRTCIMAPEEATHVQLEAITLELDLGKEWHRLNSATALIGLNAPVKETLVLKTSLQPGCRYPILLLLGIRFCKKRNTSNEFLGRKNNALALAEISQF